MISWSDKPEPEITPPSLIGWGLVIVRLFALALVIFGLMVPLVILRLTGFHMMGQYIVQFACRLCLRIIGLRLTMRGMPMRHHGGVVANHASWLDIFTLNAAQRIYFVSKADVSGWPVLGPIARSTGTMFIERKSTQALKQKQQITARIAAGHKLLFFPEGTSTDGRRILPFRSSLFAAFFEASKSQDMWIQPVTVMYHAPNGARADFYGWWGDMGFAPHFAMVLSRWRQGHISMTLHAPLHLADFTDRKALSRTAEQGVRAGFQINPDV